MPPSKKANAGLTYDSLYEVLDIKRSTYREWMSKVMPTPKWKVVSADVLLFVRILRDAVRTARMIPSEMEAREWDVIFDKVKETPLNQLSEYNLICNFLDGSVGLKHKSKTLQVKSGQSPLLLSDVVNQHLLGLANIGRDTPNNVTLFCDRSEQYYEQSIENEEAS